MGTASCNAGSANAHSSPTRLAQGWGGAASCKHATPMPLGTSTSEKARLLEFRRVGRVQQKAIVRLDPPACCAGCGLPAHCQAGAGRHRAMHRGSKAPPAPAHLGPALTHQSSLPYRVSRVFSSKTHKCEKANNSRIEGQGEKQRKKARALTAALTTLGLDTCLWVSHGSWINHRPPGSPNAESCPAARVNRCRLAFDTVWSCHTHGPVAMLEA
jgi:hypothetical protein